MNQTSSALNQAAAPVNQASAPESLGSSSELLQALEDARPRPRRRLLVGAAVALVLVLGVAALWVAAQQASDAASRSPAYVTEPLSTADISQSVTTTGNLEPTNEVTVGSELSGTVLEVFVDTNDRVTKGQPLAKLDTTNFEQALAISAAGLRSAQANVTQAAASRDEAQAELERFRELSRLSDGKLPSRAEMVAAESALARAEASVLVGDAAVGEAQARVTIDESDLGKAVIKSPIDGIVLTRGVEPGQTVAASFTAPELFVIAEKLELMKLLVSVAEADIARLEAGQPARFTVDAYPNRTFDATVLKVSFGSSVTDNVVTYETELSVSNADLSLRPGMTATAEILVASEAGAFVVSPAALRFDPTSAMAASAAEPTEERSLLDSLTPRRPNQRSRTRASVDASSPASSDGAHIWVLVDGRPEAIAVETGLDDGDRVQVISPQLAAGLAVITRSEDS